MLPLDIHAYRETGIPFYAVVTNTLTGKAEYIRVKPENMNEVLPASCAIPLASHEYPEVHGVPMTDGGVADSIPVIEAYRRGARHLTVILSEPLGYRLKPMPFPWMIRTLLKTRPALAQARSSARTPWSWGTTGTSARTSCWPPGANTPARA